MSNVEEMIGSARARAGGLAMPGLAAAPRRRVAVLTCMDARIDPPRMLGLQRGDAHVIRNAGGIVTEDALRSLSISQRLLGTEEIVVIMHDGCGLQGASEQDFAAALAADGADGVGPMGSFEDVERALAEGLAMLRQALQLPARDAIRGFVFDPESGTLREVDPP